MKPLLGLCLLLAVAACALADPSVSLTIYNKDMATVHETRPLKFERGVSELSFTDVAARLDPTSVQFSAPGVDLLEQNFDYDLVSSDALLRRFIGKEIEVVGENSDVARGTLLNMGTDPNARYSNDRNIVLQQEDGRLRTITSNRVVEVRYPSLPEGLISRPTLRWKVRAADGGSKAAEISYLTHGMNWRADYSLLIGDKTDEARMEAWVTVDNKCGATYRDAKLKLIAGEIHHAQPGAPALAMSYKSSGGGTEPDQPFESRGFFEYHLYELQDPTTLRDRETKQISLFAPATLHARRVYEFNPQRRADHVGVMVEFQNKEANGLGMPLPEGLVRVFQKDTDGARELLGDDRIEHTPSNETVRVRVGEAFDIAIGRVAKDQRGAAGQGETDIEVRIRNHKPGPVSVIVTDYFGGDWVILKASHAMDKVNASKLECTVLCEPEQEVLITYTIRRRA